MTDESKRYIYAGLRIGEHDTAVVTITERADDGREFVRQLQPTKSKSACGLDWGVRGSFTRELAYSLLLHHYQNAGLSDYEERAEAWYKSVADIAFSRLPPQGWKMDSDYIDEVLRVLDAQTRTSPQVDPRSTVSLGG